MDSGTDKEDGKEDAFNMPERTPRPDRNSPPGPGDFYFEGPYMVFTAQYLKRRGYCCKSGCRHCPYGYKKLTDS
jgi:hypothetical protein